MSNIKVWEKSIDTNEELAMLLNWPLNNLVRYIARNKWDTIENSLAHAIKRRYDSSSEVREAAARIVHQVKQGPAGVPDSGSLYALTQKIETKEYGVLEGEVDGDVVAILLLSNYERYHPMIKVRKDIVLTEVNISENEAAAKEAAAKEAAAKEAAAKEAAAKEAAAKEAAAKEAADKEAAAKEAAAKEAAAKEAAAKEAGAGSVK